EPKQTHPDSDPRYVIIDEGIGKGTGDRQDCQRISGKRRRKFMAVLSVPTCQRCDFVRCTMIFLAVSSSAEAFGIMSAAASTSGSVRAKMASLSSTLKAVVYIS